MVFEKVEGGLDSTGILIDSCGSGGCPVIFLHSLAGSVGHWSFQLQHLEKKRLAIAMLLPGHAASTPLQDEGCSIDSLARDVGAVVDELDLSRFVLVGHSFGATVAIAYAGANPQRVAGLLLADPSGDARAVPAQQASSFIAALQSDSYASAIEEYYGQLLAESRPPVREKVLQDLKSTSPQTVVCLFKALLKFDPLTSLGRYSGPRLSVVTQQNDAPFSLHKLAADLPIVQLEGTSHWLQMDRPDEFNRILDQFLLFADTAETELSGEGAGK